MCTTLITVVQAACFCGTVKPWCHRKTPLKRHWLMVWEICLDCIWNSWKQLAMMGLRLVLCAPDLSSKVSWNRLQCPHDPGLNKLLRKWMDLSEFSSKSGPKCRPVMKQKMSFIQRLKHRHHKPGKTMRRQKGGTNHNSTKAARKTGIFIQTHPIQKETKGSKYDQESGSLWNLKKSRQKSCTT